MKVLQQRNYEIGMSMGTTSCYKRSVPASIAFRVDPTTCLELALHVSHSLCESRVRHVQIGLGSEA